MLKMATLSVTVVKYYSLLVSCLGGWGAAGCGVTDAVMVGVTTVDVDVQEGFRS